MKVRAIGWTQPQLLLRDHWNLPAEKAHGSAFEQKVAEDPGNLSNILEFAGRLCYESWAMPNPDTQDTGDYIRHIIAQGHESVLEHASVTFYIEGVSRNLTHELIRHRHLSYSELSQRFVNMEEAKMVAPPAMGGGTEDLDPVAAYEYRTGVEVLQRDGKTRKQAREAARAFLPSCMETKIVVTGNLRAWRDVLKKRYSAHADAEIQMLATELLFHLGDLYPAVFEDIKYQED